ncbi:DUF5624 domain-containing protein [Legionella waltersii]|uniref:DUF5624 domain-containing protein n=1 Tax=Legionella waltersii TaxID=66969 RepID=A0A0W1AMB3_9GAMM|nr:DUF5624 domain-containing protein [Legionella waltersii]KTD82490.1 hypothetical protein Lwal_0607 [Legionella waltersii]SNV02835.1 Uncharacterised protein [Legionella waltersii]
MSKNLMIVKIILCLLLFNMKSLYADSTEPYTTPTPFMELYFDFTGKGEPDFPKGKSTISDYLIQSEKSKQGENIYDGPLILFLDSSIYIYDSHKKLLYSKLLRTNRSSGFFEMTAISHIGPALSYLAKIKENGDPSWKPAMVGLLEDIKQVKALNALTENNWLDRANIKSWQPHKEQIRAMVDYATSMSGNYIVTVLNGAPFDLSALQQNFLNGNKEFPIPYNSVMVATFMLTAINSMSEIHDGVANLNLDWSKAMVIVRNVAGGNVSAGLTAGTNWMVPFVNALSNSQIPSDRVIIAPYAQVLPEVGKDPLADSAYQYYAYAVWGSIYNRSKIAQSVFTQINTIYLPGRPAIPGDYGYTKSSDIGDFLIRLKYSLLDPREMLSNTVGFWVAGEMQNKNWDVEKIEIPGLTTGFPKGVSKYPDKNPVIALK